LLKNKKKNLFASKGFKDMLADFRVSLLRMSPME